MPHYHGDLELWVIQSGGTLMFSQSQEFMQFGDGHGKPRKTVFFEHFESYCSQLLHVVEYCHSSSPEQKTVHHFACRCGLSLRIVNHANLGDIY